MTPEDNINKLRKLTSNVLQSVTPETDTPMRNALTRYFELLILGRGSWVFEQIANDLGKYLNTVDQNASKQLQRLANESRNIPMGEVDKYCQELGIYQRVTSDFDGLFIQFAGGHVDVESVTEWLTTRNDNDLRAYENQPFSI